MSEGARPRRLPVPGPLDDREAGLEADLRRREAWGRPLTPEEGDLLTRLPARAEIPPEVVREAARAAGGVEPRPAALHPEDATAQAEEKR